MPTFNRPSEGSAITHTEVNSHASNLYSRINNRTNSDILPKSLLSAHLPTAIVAHETKAFTGGSTHAYVDTNPAHDFPGYNAAAGSWAVVGSTLGTPDTLSVNFGTTLQTSTTTLATYVGCVLVLCNINFVSMVDGGGADATFWGAFALQYNDGVSWTHLAWTERLFRGIKRDNVHMHFLIPGSAFSTMSQIRVVCSVTRGAGASAATMTLSDAQLIAIGYRASAL